MISFPARSSLDPPGKTMMQFVDPDGRLRIDVFRAYEGTISRAVPLDLPLGKIQIVSVEDLLARTARGLLDLASGVAVPSKHAADFWRLAQLAKPAEVERRVAGPPQTGTAGDFR